MFHRFQVETANDVMFAPLLSETALSEWDAKVARLSNHVMGLHMSACLTCGSVMLRSFEPSHVCAMRHRRERRHLVKVDGDFWSCVDCGAVFSEWPSDDLVCSGSPSGRGGSGGMATTTNLDGDGSVTPSS